MLRKFFFIVFLIGLIAFALWRGWRISDVSVFTDQPLLNIVADATFFDARGPGEELRRQFEQRCQCRVRFHSLPNMQMITSYLNRDVTPRYDVVMSVSRVTVSADLHRHARAVSIDEVFHPGLTISGQLEFIPYDWAPMAILYRGSRREFKSAADFVESDLLDKALVVAHPATSLVGQSFKQLQMATPLPEKAWHKKIAMTPGDWSQAYQLFTQSQGLGVFTFLTSLVYHWRDEKDRGVQPILFRSGHPLYVEYAFIEKKCLSCDLAERWIHFLLEEPSQKQLAEKNYMLPAVANVETEWTHQLPDVTLLLEDAVESSEKSR